MSVAFTNKNSPLEKSLYGKKYSLGRISDMNVQATRITQQGHRKNPSQPPAILGVSIFESSQPPVWLSRHCCRYIESLFPDR